MRLVLVGAGGAWFGRPMVVIGVNSRTWRPVTHGLPIKIIEEHEKEVEASCRDGNFRHFLELANTKWRAVRGRDGTTEWSAVSAR